MSIYITTDSTCDLGEQAQKRNITVMPLTVILGTQSFRDGVNITPTDIFAYVDEKGELPKTAALNASDYDSFFEDVLKQADEVIHISLSSKASCSNANAIEASKKFEGKVTVIDSKALSTGQGLLCMKAADLRDEGKTVKEIVEEITTLSNKVNTSFVPDRLDYLFKGGRCSRMTMYGANLLKIHPIIEMKDGQLFAEKKCRGSMEKCITTYINGLKELYPEYDKTRVFITHSNADENLVSIAKEKVASLFQFDEVIETVAGSVITGHCGKNTLGVLFITK